MRRAGQDWQALTAAAKLRTVLANAIPFTSPDRDEEVAWHYGDPLGEQRRLASGAGAVDLSHRGVLRLTGPDTASFLNSLTTQRLDRLAPGESALTLNLNPQGFVLHELHVLALEDQWLVSCEGESKAEVFEYLQRMRFRSKVEVQDASAKLAIVWQSDAAPQLHYPTWRSPFDWAAQESFVPRAEVDELIAPAPAGIWALEALRVAARVPRQGAETDHHTLPHEVGWIGTAVHLNKGCYRGQETVSKVERMGQPPRRAILLLLDGSEELPTHGEAVMAGGKQVGFIGTAAQHYELGPIASAVIKRSELETTSFEVAGPPASVMAD